MCYLHTTKPLFMEIVPQKQTEDLWVNRVKDVVDCSENYHIPWNFSLL